MLDSAGVSQSHQPPNYLEISMKFQQLFPRQAQDLHRSKIHNPKEEEQKHFISRNCILKNQVTQFVTHMALPSKPTELKLLKDDIVTCIFTSHAW